MSNAKYYGGSKERNDTILRASDNFMRKIGSEMARMSTRWGRISGDSKIMKKITLHREKGEKFQCRTVTYVELITGRLC